MTNLDNSAAVASFLLINIRNEVKKEKKQKTGKLLTSRRYDRPPLLHSCPGGFSRSWPYKTCQGGKGNAFINFSKMINEKALIFFQGFVKSTVLIMILTVPLSGSLLLLPLWHLDYVCLQGILKSSL